VQIAALLNRYADAYNLAVVVTNQVSDFFEDANDAANRKASSCAARVHSQSDKDAFGNSTYRPAVDALCDLTAGDGRVQAL
jgi:hypothetical protein